MSSSPDDSATAASSEIAPDSPESFPVLLVNDPAIVEGESPRKITVAESSAVPSSPDESPDERLSKGSDDDDFIVPLEIVNVVHSGTVDASDLDATETKPSESTLTEECASRNDDAGDDRSAQESVQETQTTSQSESEDAFVPDAIDDDDATIAVRPSITSSDSSHQPPTTTAVTTTPTTTKFVGSALTGSVPVLPAAILAEAAARRRRRIQKEREEEQKQQQEEEEDEEEEMEETTEVHATVVPAPPSRRPPDIPDDVVGGVRLDDVLRKPPSRSQSRDWAAATEDIRRQVEMMGQEGKAIEFVEIEGVESWSDSQDDGEQARMRSSSRIQSWTSSYDRPSSMKELRVEAFRDVISMSRKDTPNAGYWTKHRIALSVMQTLVFCLIQAVVGLNRSTLGPLIPLFAQKFSVAEHHVAWVVVAEEVGMMLASPIAGVLVECFKVKDPLVEPDDEEGEKASQRDTKKRCCRWLNVSSITVFFLVLLGCCTIACSFVTNFVVFMIIQLLRGALMCACNVSTTTAIGWIWREKVYPFMQALHCADAVGCIAGPLFIVLLHKLFGEGLQSWGKSQIFWSFLFCTVIALPLALPLCILPVPREARLVNEDVPPKSGMYAEKWGKEKPSRCKKCLTSVFSMATVVYVGMGLIMGLCEAEFESFGDLIVLYGTDSKLGSDLTLSYVSASFWGALLLSRFVTAFVVAWIPDLYVVVVSLTGNIIALSVSLAYSKNLVAIWVCAVIHALFVGPLTAACFSVPQSVFKLPVSSVSVAVMTVFGSLGVVVQITESILWEHVKPILFVVSLSVFVLSIPILVCLLAMRLLKPSAWIEKWSWVSSGSSKRQTIANARMLAKRVYYETKQMQDGAMEADVADDLVTPLLGEEQPRGGEGDEEEGYDETAPTPSDDSEDERFLFGVEKKELEELEEGREMEYQEWPSEDEGNHVIGTSDQDDCVIVID